MTIRPQLIKQEPLFRNVLLGGRDMPIRLTQALDLDVASMSGRSSDAHKNAARDLVSSGSSDDIPERFALRPLFPPQAAAGPGRFHAQLIPSRARPRLAAQRPAIASEAENPPLTKVE